MHRRKSVPIQIFFLSPAAAHVADIGVIPSYPRLQRHAMIRWNYIVHTPAYSPNLFCSHATLTGMAQRITLCLRKGLKGLRVPAQAA